MVNSTTRFELSRESRVLVDLRATGLLRSAGHDPTLSARVDGSGNHLAIDPGDGSAIDVVVAVSFAAADIEPPPGMPPADRDKMRENMLGPEVLAASRFPRIEFGGRYAGSLRAGTLSGDLRVRGALHRISMEVRGSQDSRDGKRLEVRGAWDGRLTSLGIRPYRALLGALRLDDWIRIRLEASFDLVRLMGS